MTPEGFALVPLVPTKEMLWAIACREWPADMERGKVAQRSLSWGDIPAKTELEVAYGQYERLLEHAGQTASSNVFDRFRAENQELRNHLFKVRDGLKAIGGEKSIELIALINDGLSRASDVKKGTNL